jgi:hypothetical protein
VGQRESRPELFGDRIIGVVAHRLSVTIDRFTAPADFRHYFRTHYGPTIAPHRAIAGDLERVAALDPDIDELVNRFQHNAGSATMDWEYLLLTGTKA